VAGRFRDPWRLWATAGVAGLTGAPQSVLAQSCSTTGIGPVKVTCNDPGGIITTTNATNTVSPNAATNDRIRSFHADLTAWACFCTKRAAIALVAVFFALIPLPRSAQAQAFETISPPSGYNFLGVAGVSADGLVVVGDIRPTGATSGDSQAFRWTTSTGLIGIGFLPGKDSSAALGVNADGSVIVGNSNLLNSGTASNPFRWTSSTGMVSIINSNSSASAVSADGAVVVGVAGSGVISTNPQGFRWTPSTGMIGLGFPPGAIASDASGVNGDGSVVVGTGYSPGNAQAFRWTASTGAQGLGFLPGGATTSYGRAVSSDGSAVVGYSQWPSNQTEAFRWKASTGMVGLGYLPGDNFSIAMAVNSDGSVVVGAGTVGTSSLFRAFRWTADTGMQSVYDMLAANGVKFSMWSDMVATGVSADGTVIVGNGRDAAGNYEGWIARIPINAFALLDLAGVDHTLGSLVWGGTVTNSGTHAAMLRAGSDNSSTTFIGTIQDGTGLTGLVKEGTGTLTLSGTNTYTGATMIDAGTLSVDGSIASSSLITVNAGGTLGGNGIVGNTFINGGTLAPGNSIGTLTVQGSLMFTAASTYMVEVSPSAADRTNVTGSATLGGATVNASFAPGSYVTKQYTIVNATGGINGTFGSLLNTNLPSPLVASLSYDANNAYLNLDLAVSQLPGLNGNQRNVANALTNSFNATGGIPLVFTTLTPAGLTQAAGETATGSQQATFEVMTQFITTLLDPFISGRGDSPASTAGATPFAEEDDAARAYAAAGGKRRSGAEHDAYGVITKAVPRNPVFDPRWSVWAAGFGGSQTTDGNAAQGSNDATSRVFGVAAGADYVFSPRTIAGFALAGGGTQFSVANGGTGRSDLFQAGAYLRHTNGAAYVAGALAYGWQDITTDRTVTIAGVDRLHAQFNANAFSGRVEGGYRFATPWMGITPYAAGQFTTFDLPAYAEQALSGANTFALSYGSKSVTASRSELGLRADNSWAMPNAILTLRGRLAWRKTTIATAISQPPSRRCRARRSSSTARRKQAIQPSPPLPSR
jgi:autotransporter-associated beta strand protein/probable HAF family extracellular repeat protein